MPKYKVNEMLLLPFEDYDGNTTCLLVKITNVAFGEYTYYIYAFNRYESIAYEHLDDPIYSTTSLGFDEKAAVALYG